MKIERLFKLYIEILVQLTSQFQLTNSSKSVNLSNKLTEIFLRIFFKYLKQYLNPQKMKTNNERKSCFNNKLKKTR